MNPSATVSHSPRVEDTMRRPRYHAAALPPRPSAGAGSRVKMSVAGRDVAGSVVLISGASGGIGRELVRAFLEAGAAEIIAASRRPLEQSGPRVRAHSLDVTDLASVA